MILLDCFIEDELLVCPYCGSDVGFNTIGCCGESSAHFTTAYIYNGDVVLDSEVTKIIEIDVRLCGAFLFFKKIYDEYKVLKRRADKLFIKKQRRLK